MKCPRCKTMHESVLDVCTVCGFPMICSDMVNSPSHYTQGKYETIDIILDMVKHLPGDQGYLLGNVIKYLARYHFKNGLEDLEKAQKYLEWLAREVAEHGQD